MAVDSLALTPVSSLFAHPRAAKNVSRNEEVWGKKNTVRNGREAARGVSQSAGEGGG